MKKESCWKALLINYMLNKFMTNVGGWIFLLVLLVCCFPSWGTVTPSASSCQYDVGIERVSIENTVKLGSDSNLKA
jgi:hypothetical protein